MDRVGLLGDQELRRIVRRLRAVLRVAAEHTAELHLEDFIDAENVGTLDEHLGQLSARVHEEALEEFHPIDLGLQLRRRQHTQDGAATGLKRLYNLVFQPLSARSAGRVGLAARMGLWPRPQR